LPTLQEKGGGKRHGPVPKVRERGLAAENQERSPQTLVLGAIEESGINNKFNIKVYLTVAPHETPIQVEALLDSGADGNFVDAEFASIHGLPRMARMMSSKVTGIDGRPLSCNEICEDVSVRLTCESADSTNHTEEGCSLGIISSPKHPIILGLPWLRRHQPPYGQIYHLSQDEDKLLQEYLKDNVEKGFIRKSTSSAGAPIFFVDKGKNTKQEGKAPEKRLVVNYRGLDKNTLKFRHPIPLTNDLFDKLRTGRVFTKIDLRSAYNLVRIREGDEWKTAFRTKYGLFEYLVMPFGLANAPAYFQRFVDETFRDMIGKFVVIYLDDFLIYSQDEASHQMHVMAVLQRLRENHLFGKLEKCQFDVPSVKFLGFNISSEGFSCDETKIQSITEWPTPKSKRDVEVFLGLTNYLRKFVDGFSKIAIPLQHLTKKKAKFDWSEDCQIAFTTLKTALSSSPVLRHTDLTTPFWVETDASDFAIGAVLSQKDENGDLRPCAYYSHSLKKAERNYYIYEKELLAIKMAFEEWRQYLEGGPHKITVLCDHKTLTSLANAKVVNQRHARWSIYLSRFNFAIRYRPGSQNSHADALSRRPDYQTSEGPPEEQTILRPNTVEIATVTTISPSPFVDRIRDLLEQDRHYLTNWIENPSDVHTLINGIPYFQDRLYIPEGPLRVEALSTCHEAKLAGHYGRRKTAELVSRKFFWPGMKKEVDDFCAACQVCGRSKSSRHRPYGPLMPLSIAECPWASVSMDFVTNLPMSNGMTCIFTIVDRFSKMAHFVAIPKIPDAEETASLFLQEIVRLHGLPREVISDRGSQFVSHFWKRLLELLDIQQCLSSAYHPQSDGQSERANQVLQQYIRCFISYNQDNWFQLLPLAEFTFNNTMNVSTGFTPFFTNYGQHPRFEIISPADSQVPAVEERLNTLKEVHEKLRINLSKAVKDQKRFADKHRRATPTLETGGQVWLDARNIVRRDRCAKLDYKRLGPFPVRREINPVAYELELPPSLKIHPVFHTSLLEKVKVNKFSGRQHAQPPPIQVNDEEEFLVEEILDARIAHGRLEYFVDWEGYPPSERCWVPARNVHAPRKVKEFYLRYPTKPRPRNLRRRRIFREGSDVRNEPSSNLPS
jgi:transposase InsO family protein